MSPKRDRFTWLRLLYRLPWLLVHALLGTPVTVICQTTPGRRLRLGRRSLAHITLCWWAATVCRIFGLRRRVEGELPAGPALIAANHISWIDIQVLHSLSPMGFVAKAEIASWPVIGRLAAAGDTVFHQRGSHGSSAGVSAAMAESMRDGSKVAIFPEGGILSGSGVKRFHARMFAPAIEAGYPVLPVMLRYLRDGDLYEDITFGPREHFLGNFFRLLVQRPCIAEVRVLEALEPEGKQRRLLASEAEAAVRAAYEAPLSNGGPRD